MLHDFNSPNGWAPMTGLVSTGAMLYGTTRFGNAGSPIGDGTVFRMRTDGSGYKLVKHFGLLAGGWPRSKLLLAGTTLYGTTLNGGTSRGGTVFRLNTDGSGYTLLKEFSGTEPRIIRGGLVSNGETLYGTALSGGASNLGAVFAIRTDGSAFKVLRSFSGTDGASPRGSLTIVGDALYGTTQEGGDFGQGTVFRLDMDGNDFTTIFHFAGTSGSTPVGSLVWSDGFLLGSTAYGGAGSDGIDPSSGNGTIFRIGTNGNDFTVLRALDGTNDGSMPQDGLLLAGTNLFGTTYSGGESNLGTVFQIGTDGNAFTVLKSFLGPEGQHPQCDLVLVGTTLFGTAPSGGAYSRGVVFGLGPPVAPSIETAPESQTAEVGSNVVFAATGSAFPPPQWQWYFNGTNLLYGCTDHRLERTNVQATDCGSYGAVVQNDAGSANTPSADLNVIPRVERTPVPGIRLTGQPGSVAQVEFTELLGETPAWLPLGIVSLNETAQFCCDPEGLVHLRRFYRAWQPQMPELRTSLSLHLIPAITLGGNIGDKFHLDFINAVGPTNAWSPLGQIILTNTSQLYFDVSALGQPPRLYRIEPVP